MLKLKLARVRAGMTQLTLANQAGVTTSFFSLAEPD
jgi:DNA-binding XRE family transcriptional regulator